MVELSLIGGVSVRAPSAGHINYSNALQHQECKVRRSIQFSSKDTPDGAGFTNKSGPELHLWKTESSIVGPSRGKSGTHSNALGVI